jgi:hypothetical protein
MANSKEYSYFIKGNKIGLVERDANDSSGLTSPSGVPDIDLPNSFSKWKSPLTDITNGLEIEYVYSPEWSIPLKDQYGDNVWLMNGWTVVDGYLTFLRADHTNTSRPDWSSKLSVDQHILIKNSDRWNGLHKVQEAQAKVGTSHAGVKTYTKVTLPAGYVTESGHANINETYTALETATVNTVMSWDHVWISGSTQLQNQMFVSKASGDSSTGVLSLSGVSTYYVQQEVHTTETTTNADMASQSSYTIHFREAFRDSGMIMYTDVDVMTDESDDIDLPAYLSKALVYYVKGKLAEDVGEFEASEYFMSKFRKQVEKHESAKVPGPRRIFPGTGSIT